MARAVITLSDDGKGAVDVSIAFDPDGADEDSEAHVMAMAMIKAMTEGEEDEVCGHG